jgi:hypothetical protein
VASPGGDVGLVFPYAGTPLNKAIKPMEEDVPDEEYDAAADFNDDLARAAAETLLTVLHKLHGLVGGRAVRGWGCRPRGCEGGPASGFWLSSGPGLGGAASGLGAWPARRVRHSAPPALPGPP